MGCNCKKGTTALKYEHTNAKGQKTTYNSEIAARAAQIKTGGSWRTVPA